jgi:Flp pilus assembly pilin Flp
MTERAGTTMLDSKGRWDSMLRRIRAYIAHEQGQTMAEYAVVLSVITVATLAAFTALSGGIQGAITNVTGVL